MTKLQANLEEEKHADAFSCLDALPNNAAVGASSADKVAAAKVHVGLGYAKLAVCRHLNIGMGRISEAIVFDTAIVGMGGIDKLHCLHSTKQIVGLGRIGQAIYYSLEDLVDLALEKLDMERPVAEQVMGEDAASGKPSLEAEAVKGTIVDPE